MRVLWIGEGNRREVVGRSDQSPAPAAGGPPSGQAEQ